MSLPTLESVGLSSRELIQLGKDLGEGRLGIDPARSSKAELVMFLEGKYDPAAIAGALGRMFPGREAAVPAPVADEPRDVTPQAPVSAAPAAHAGSVGELAAALAAVVSHASPAVDDEYIRRIVRQELALWTADLAKAIQSQAST